LGLMWGAALDGAQPVRARLSVSVHIPTATPAPVVMFPVPFVPRLD